MNTKSYTKYAKNDEVEPIDMDSDDEPFIDQGAGIKYGVLSEANAIVALILNVIMLPSGYIFGALTDERKFNKVYFTMFIVGIVIWVAWIVTMLLVGICEDVSSNTNPELCKFYRHAYNISEYVLIVNWIAGLVYGYNQIKYSKSPKLREALGYD